MTLSTWRIVNKRKPHREYELIRDPRVRLIECGHQTAIWPFWGQLSTGHRVMTHNGRGFSNVEDAQARIERIENGEDAAMLQCHVFCGAPTSKVTTSGVHPCCLQRGHDGGHVPYEKPKPQRRKK